MRPPIETVTIAPGMYANIYEDGRIELVLADPKLDRESGEVMKFLLPNDFCRHLLTVREIGVERGVGDTGFLGMCQLFLSPIIGLELAMHKALHEMTGSDPAAGVERLKRLDAILQQVNKT